MVLFCVFLFFLWGGSFHRWLAGGGLLCRYHVAASSPHVWMGSISFVLYCSWQRAPFELLTRAWFLCCYLELCKAAQQNKDCCWRIVFQVIYFWGVGWVCLFVFVAVIVQKVGTELGGMTCREESNPEPLQHFGVRFAHSTTWVKTTQSLCWAEELETVLGLMGNDIALFFLFFS